MEDGQDESRIALKIVFVLSLLLVSMDVMEIYFAYTQLIETSTTIDALIFESCVKYHILSQMFFTAFATFAGISACIMSIGLVINFEFFAVKVMDTFLHFNYLIFGPYLFGSCLLGYYNFSKIAFNCDSRNINKTYLNLSTVLALFICILFSFIVTIGYSIFWSLRKFMFSIRFRPEGNYVLGRIFWRYVFNRSNDSIQLANGGQSGNNIQISNNVIPRNQSNAGGMSSLARRNNDVDGGTYVDMIRNGNSINNLNQNRQNLEMSEVRPVNGSQIPLLNRQHNSLDHI